MCFGRNCREFFGDVFDAVFFRNIGSMTKDSALFQAKFFNLRFEAVETEHEAENAAWSDKLFFKKNNSLKGSCTAS